jgi:hypothetical protein
VVYGSLGAGIATLVWLYMISLSVLIGAEFNAQLFPFPDLRPVSVPNEEFPGDPSLVGANSPSNSSAVPTHAARSAAAR